MKQIPLILFAVAIINFMAFVCIAYRIGGDAVNGKIENGRYFLANHGVFTEVSAAIFTYSLWHVRSLIVTCPMGLFAMWSLSGWIRKQVRTSN